MAHRSYDLFFDFVSAFLKIDVLFRIILLDIFGNLNASCRILFQVSLSWVFNVGVATGRKLLLFASVH